jgi:8-oxo-dGTP pyrophosphatase MutT (NUDIX family)
MAPVTDVRSLLTGVLDDPLEDPPLPDGIPAAVVVPLVEGPSPSLIFTKRTTTVRDHKGEISFPGGARHGEDPDLRTTALRETEEELGIPREAFQVMGRLPITHTIVTGYVIVPFVGLLPARPPMTPSGVEIAEVIELNLGRLASVEKEVERRGPGVFRTWFAYELDGHTVWGATGRIVHGLLETLRAAGWTEEG